jgi:hypothetical protein
MTKEKILSPEQQEELLKILKVRFEENMDRHKGIDWSAVESKLKANPAKLWSLNEMEITGGEPDVVEHDRKTKEYIFYDCSPESPAGRRNICYDKAALESRKKYKPKNSAERMADEMGIEILSEKQYMTLQELGEFDTKTSSWLETPDDIRGRGGAIYGDRRFGRVFIYHNGAESYYGVRGFRGSLRV